MPSGVHSDSVKPRRSRLKGSGSAVFLTGESKDLVRQIAILTGKTMSDVVNDLVVEPARKEFTLRYHERFPQGRVSPHQVIDDR